MKLLENGPNRFVNLQVMRIELKKQQQIQHLNDLQLFTIAQFLIFSGFNSFVVKEGNNA